ncbi:hypothetical protein TP47_00350 (plasmid) [Xanthomonas citri pv. aurantifolii]|nr:hypothetical protein TP37_10705 [Xanthomonas citri pv. aurantifolii]AMV03397.1 hypothetical protein TP50_13870 [Xanthomonas citri pv. aurantifolii]TBW93182.1 hypothetical protein TP49_22280 [Xanthomonas citri pv. aurantifolii]TBX01911.1 hypothetical protein TP47_00350 [Xanthomonas citri pv. aurantifolii]TBX04631.1 hypothetical protein TP46_04370 [Xanthomonas citri pv. aurantifolii]
MGGEMAVLTDILVAPAHDAPAIISEWPGEKRWPAIEATGLDGLVFEELAVALGHPRLAEAIQDLDPSSFADEANGPWVYVLPTELREQLVVLLPEDFARVSKAWSQGEEARGRGLTPEIAEGLLRQLHSLANRAHQEDRALLLWISL